MIINSIQISFLFILLAILIYSAKNKIERYIQIIFFSFVFIDFSVAPGVLGVSLFDMLTFFITPFFISSNYKNKILISKKIKIIFFVFSFFLIIGSFLSINSLISFLRLFQHFNYLVFFLIFTSYINDKKNYIRIKPYIIYSLLFCLIFLIIQTVIGLNFTFYSQLNSNVNIEGTRFPGPFQDPQKLAQFLAMASCLFFSLSLNSKKKRLQYFLYGILMIIGIFFSGSRGALFGLTIGVFYFMIKQTIKTKKIIYLFIISIVSVFTFFISENSMLFKRAEKSDDDLAFRAAIWTKAYSFFTENPILGIGTGGYSEFVQKRDPDQFWLVNDEIVYYNHPESGFLLWLVEFGIVVFLILITVILYMVNPFFKSKIKKDNSITLLEAGIIAWVISFITVDSLGDKRIGVTLLILFSLLYLSKYNRTSKNIKFIRTYICQ